MRARIGSCRKVDADIANESPNDAGESSLTDSQILALGNVLSMGFYYYTNLDNVLTGTGAGVKSGNDMPPLPPNAKKKMKKLQESDPSVRQRFAMSISESILSHQCCELKNRYDELKCPLGPDSVLKSASAPPAQTKKIKGKKGKIIKGANRMMQL
mmetsp:Transcript_22240/g.48313  ORF Transcript_22240/g.48313 Transcript_22240/m.48313 type:complete len:156 (+) Transcript_22240:162-629(+)